ncbi:MAG TPA: hypothetical protein VEC99_01860 [Clostridia bacterium]|nr:hypothetical protein [Clostridia bacterium]
MRQASKDVNQRLMRLFQQTGLGDVAIETDALTLQLRRWHFRHVLFSAPVAELLEPFKSMRRMPPFMGSQEAALIQLQEQLSTVIDVQVQNIRESYNYLPYSDDDALWRRLLLVAFVFAEQNGEKAAHLHEVDLYLSQILEEGGLENLERFVRMHGYTPAEKDELDPAWKWQCS